MLIPLMNLFLPWNSLQYQLPPLPLLLRCPSLRTSHRPLLKMGHLLARLLLLPLHHLWVLPRHSAGHLFHPMAGSSPHLPLV